MAFFFSTGDQAYRAKNSCGSGLDDSVWNTLINLKQKPPERSGIKLTVLIRIDPDLFDEIWLVCYNTIRMRYKYSNEYRKVWAIMVKESHIRVKLVGDDKKTYRVSKLANKNCRDIYLAELDKTVKVSEIEWLEFDRNGEKNIYKIVDL